MPLSVDRLKTLLQDDIKDLTKLSEILNKERTALKERSNTAIQTLASEKSTCIKSIEYRAKEKAKMFVDAGYQIKKGEFEKAIAEIQDPSLQALWRKVNIGLRFCQDQNTINGKVVSHSLKRVNKLMDIVRGQHNKPNLYGSSGKENSFGGLNSIAKA
ncbi:flagella synthesis protein FlgN [Alkalimarinus sediminis]|uniref:Flagellar protein FlgN n=1 Tax=Alkalimarinus sediminis TaxID=1632866 RepID=A0A9E8HUG5_9ALTE|nr:flagellar protein FlgN [Alkalimarinus sediminis]UZW75944.1 flagellar protein FlgN [Alkalimarinus sediminis]